MKLVLLGCWPILLITAGAETVTFPVGTTVTSSGGTYTVIRGDYKFSRTGALSINTFVDAYRHAGGLYVGAPSAGVKIERVDGQPFSIENMSIMERPGTSSPFTQVSFSLSGYPPGVAIPISRSFVGDGSSQNYDYHMVRASDPRFGNVTSAYLTSTYTFILDVISLGPVAENVTQPAPIINVVADASLEVNPGDPGVAPVTAGAWTFAATATIVPPGGTHNAAAPADGSRIGVIYPAEETGLPSISQIITIPAEGRYRLGWWEVGGPPIEGVLNNFTHYLNYVVKLDSTTIASRQAQNRSGLGATLNPLPPLDFHFVSVEFAATAGPHTLSFIVTGSGDSNGGGIAYIDAVSLIPAAQAIFPIIAPPLAMAPPNAGQVSLTWDTVPGYFYRVETSEDLALWSEPAATQVPLTSRSETFSIPTGAARFFLRVRYSDSDFSQ